MESEFLVVKSLSLTKKSLGKDLFLWGEKVGVLLKSPVLLGVMKNLVKEGEFPVRNVLLFLHKLLDSIQRNKKNCHGHLLHGLSPLPWVNCFRIINQFSKSKLTSDSVGPHLMLDRNSPKENFAQSLDQRVSRFVGEKRRGNQRNRMWNFRHHPNLDLEKHFLRIFMKIKKDFTLPGPNLNIQEKKENNFEEKNVLQERSKREFTSPRPVVVNSKKKKKKREKKRSHRESNSGLGNQNPV